MMKQPDRSVGYFVWGCVGAGLKRTQVPELNTGQISRARLDSEGQDHGFVKLRINAQPLLYLKYQVNHAGAGAVPPATRSRRLLRLLLSGRCAGRYGGRLGGGVTPAHGCSSRDASASRALASASTRGESGPAGAAGRMRSAC